VSRWLSWSDFFSRQVQDLQFPTHHADTGREAPHGFDPFTQFGQTHIGLLFHFGAEEVVAGLQGAGWAAGVGQRGTTAAIPPAIQPLFEGGLMDAEPGCHFGFGAFAGVVRGDGAVA